MKNKPELVELARKHGIATTKRLWFDVLSDNGSSLSRYMDLPRPVDELHKELVAIGVIT